MKEKGSKHVSMNPHEERPGTYPVATGQGAYPRSAGAPVNFQDLVRAMYHKYKTVVTHPNVATFDAELPAATWKTVWFGAVSWAAAWAVGMFFASLVNRSAYSQGPTIGTLLGTFIVFVGGFFFGVGVMHLTAKLFQGSAPFCTYAYALSLALVPVTAIGAVAFIIPGLGAWLFLAAQLYGIYLCVLATQAAHRVVVGMAWAIVLIPSAAAVVFSYFLATLFVVLLVAVSVPSR